MNKLASIAVIVSLGALAGCTAEHTEPSGSSSSKIIGGSGDSAHPSVGFVRSVIQVGFDGSPVAIEGCTATLIAPTVMVTAAHCAGDARLWTDVSFEVAPDQFAAFGAQGWIPASLVVHPQYDGDTSHGHDVAVVLLGGRPERPVVALAPPPPVGATVTAVGYGMDVFGSNGAGAGQRRTVDITVLGIAEHELVAGRDGLGTCHGDSGGPLLADGALIGTTSYGDTVDCHSSGHFMRVDDNVDFLRRYAP